MRVLRFDIATIYMNPLHFYTGTSISTQAAHPTMMVIVNGGDLCQGLHTFACRACLKIVTLVKPKFTQAQ
jgi:hypothetical protein